MVWKVLVEGRRPREGGDKAELRRDPSALDLRAWGKLAVRPAQRSSGRE